MTMPAVFCALIEVTLLDGCEFNPEENAGAAVRCYIPARNAEQAMSMLGEELGRMKMKLTETEWCVDYEATEWDKPGDQTELNFVDESRKTGDIIFGTFHTWGHDAPDA